MTSVSSTNILHTAATLLLSLIRVRKKRTKKQTIFYHWIGQNKKKSENSICVLKELGIDFLNKIDETQSNH